MTRLTQLPTLRINPAKNLPFMYRGKKYQGVSGDTVATALYANEVRIFSRSIKYHRPRGLYSLDGECGNCLMAVDGLPNVQAETTPLLGGMSIEPQNVRGNPEWDVMGIMDQLDWAMPAGFYYQRFHKPYKLWPFFQNRIRKLAGTGKIDPAFDMKGRFDEQHLNADVCVLGGGPAGIHAAQAAADQGLRVIILERRPWMGGFFDYRTAAYAPGVPLYAKARELASQLEDISRSGTWGREGGIRAFPHTSVTGYYSNNHITAVQTGGENDRFTERYLDIRAKSVVVATGCIERPLLFEENDRPGIMQVGCAHRMARTFGLLSGKAAVFSVGHDLGLEAAIDLFDLGMQVTAVADCRPDVQDQGLTKALAERDIPLLQGWVACRSGGNGKVTRVTLSTLEGLRHQEFECDLLVASAGLTPCSGPLSLSGAKMAYDIHTGFFLPEQLPLKVHAAGRLLGYHDPLSIEASGHLAGLEAAKDCGAGGDDVVKTAQEKLESLPGPVTGSKVVLPPVKGGRKMFICFDEDTTVKHVNQACDMGFDKVELAKRFTGAGTGPGQGGIPGHNLPLLISRYHSDSNEVPLPSTVRPPLVPTLLATYAGRNHDMAKRTPLHDSQKAAGGVFRRIGVWKRARYFSEDLTCREEVENVRNNVGMIDVSTLGKFRIFGPDAANALQRIYVGNMADIPSGKMKYSAVCNEDGCLIDDGVITQLGENNYYFTTSTARAGATIEWFRYHTRYEKWDFHMVNLTDAFGAINLAGPNARKVLEKVADADVSNDAFPFMGYRSVALKEKTSDVSEYSGISEIPVGVMRLGFVGEISFEIHVPASLMQSAWDLLMKAGEEFDVRPFGVEAQNLLRLEKGHLIIGQESEIRTTLHDLGLGFLWDQKHAGMSTIGVPALRFTKYQTGRLRLVGFKVDKTDASYRTPKDGSIIVDDTIRGHVCTSRYSFTLEEPIGLALVGSRLAKAGTRMAIFEDGMEKDERLYATVVSTPFYDPEGERLRG